MSLPTEFDFALVKIGDGATPTEHFDAICGIENAVINMTVSTTDHFVRDCAAPGKVPQRRVKVDGKQCDITGSGLSNADTIQDLIDALGFSKNYRVEGYRRDGTDTGELLGTYAGPFVMTANNLSITAQATGEITLASDGDVTYTPAP